MMTRRHARPAARRFGPGTTKKGGFTPPSLLSWIACRDRVAFLYGKPAPPSCTPTMCSNQGRVRDFEDLCDVVHNNTRSLSFSVGIRKEYSSPN